MLFQSCESVGLGVTPLASVGGYVQGMLICVPHFCSLMGVWVLQEEADGGSQGSIVV